MLTRIRHEGILVGDVVIAVLQPRYKFCVFILQFGRIGLFDSGAMSESDWCGHEASHTHRFSRQAFQRYEQRSLASVS